MVLRRVPFFSLIYAKSMVDVCLIHIALLCTFAVNMLYHNALYSNYGVDNRNGPRHESEIGRIDKV